jgi:hypothetical protein
MDVEDKSMDTGTKYEQERLRWQHGTGSHSGGVNLEPGIEVAQVLRKHNQWHSTITKVLDTMGYTEDHIGKILEVAYAD